MKHLKTHKMEPEKTMELEQRIILLEAKIQQLEQFHPQPVRTLIAHQTPKANFSFIFEWISARLPNTKELLYRISPFTRESPPQQFNATLELMKHLPAYQIVRIAKRYQMDLGIDPKVAVKGADLNNLLDEQRKTFQRLMIETRLDLRGHFEKEKYRIGQPLKTRTRITPK